MKLLNKSLALALALVAAAPLAAQLTPVPDHFTDWTGKADSNFFNPANWSTGVVPDSATAAIRLPGDTTITNKHIVANYTGAGDKTIQFYSIQTGANKSYTVEFSGNDDGWLILNPVGKGFTFNGMIGSTPQLGRSLDLTYPESTGDDPTRLAAYYILGKNTLLTAANSYAGLRVDNNGLSSGIFTLKENARMDLSKAGDIPFIYNGVTGGNAAVVTFTANRQTNVVIGGLLETGPDSTIYVGSRYVSLNSKLTSGQVSIMGGLFYQDPSDSNGASATCDVFGDITRMTGQVNFEGDGRARFRIRSGAQYLVEGVHVGGIKVYSGGVVGGSGHIKGAIDIDEGGLITPGYRGSTVGNSPDTPLTINATNFSLNGSMAFDLVTDKVYDRMNVTLSGTMTVRSPATVDMTAVSNPRFANLIINTADSFPRFVPKPLEFRPMTITLDLAASGTNVMILGDFRDVDEHGNVTRENVTLPASVTLKTTWRWEDTMEYNYQAQMDLLKQRTLVIKVEQMPFDSVEGLSGNRLVAAKGVAKMYHLLVNRVTGDVRDERLLAEYQPLFEALNRQPSIIQYNEVLDQLTPVSYQAWFPSAVVRTNALVQSLDDRMYQDAAYARKKGSWQMFLDGYRNEASRGKDDNTAYSNYGTIGTVVGADYAFGENFVAGGFIGYDKTDFDLDTVGGTCDVNSITLGAKARYTYKNLQVNATLFYGTDDYKSSRTVALTGLGDWAQADTDGTRLGTSASVGYTFRPEWFEITPTAGIQLLKWDADGFQERNAGQAGLRVYSQSENSFAGKLGIRIAKSFKLKHGFLRPYFHYAFLHEFASGERTIKADLFESPMQITAPATNANGYRIDVGLDWNITRKLRGEVRYQSEYRGAASESVGVRAGVNYTF